MQTNAAANIAAFMGGCATMVIAMGLVWRRHPTRYMRAWFVAFLGVAMTNMGLVFEAWWGFQWWIALLVSPAVVAGALGFWAGIRDFAGVPPLQIGIKRLVMAIAVIYVLTSCLLAAYEPFIRMPLVVLILSSYVRVGIWQRDLARTHGYLGAKLGVWVSLLLCLVMLLYPITVYVPWVHDAGNLANGILYFLYGLGFLIMVFERSQAELHHLKDHLEAEVARRSQELAVAERLAAIGQVAAGIAHDVKNKLTVVQTAATLVTDLRADAGTQAAAGERLRRAVQDTSRLVREMMAMTAPHAVAPERVDVRHLVEGLLPGLLPAGIQRVTAWSEAETAAIVEAKALEQVIANVLINAVEAMGGNGVLTIATDRREGYICLQITDTGPGVAPEVREHLFEPFYTTKLNGNGLGLAISKRLIEQQGGLIALDGALGQGARVTLLLPVAEVAAPSDQTDVSGVTVSDADRHLPPVR